MNRANAREAQRGTRTEAQRVNQRFARKVLQSVQTPRNMHHEAIQGQKDGDWSGERGKEEYQQAEDD
jgi:hypothetical protein